ALCKAAGNQLANFWEPTIASDGAGGAIVTWQDQRTNANGDIYARRAQPPESPTIDVVWGDTFLQVVWTGGGDVADTGTPLRWVVYVDGDSVGGLAQAPGVDQVVEVDGTPPSNPTVPFTPCTYHHVYVRIIGQHGFLGATSNT